MPSGSADDLKPVMQDAMVSGQGSYFRVRNLGPHSSRMIEIFLGFPQSLHLNAGKIR
jgi:hypothetical protein